MNTASHKMRREDRALPEDEALKLLNQAEYGVLSTVSGEGQPYGLPLNFCFHNGAIYFHSAMEGQKIDHITAGPKVSFCVVGQTRLLPAKFSTKYESVIVFGSAEEVFAETKLTALEKLIRKYSPDHIEKGKKYIEASHHETRVFRINIDHLTGKARK